MLYSIYEVFVQKDHESPHVWVGSVDAGTPEDALLLARENFLRRESAVSIWVVPQGAVTRTDYQDRDFFAGQGEKGYRSLSAYSKANAEKWRKYKRNLLTLENDFLK